MFTGPGEALKEVRAADAMSRGAAVRRSRPPRWIVGALAASVAVAAGAFVLQSESHAPTLGFALPPAVREATEWSSARGLVLPGGERLAGQTLPVLRSGLGESSPSLEREVDSLTTLYEHARHSPELAARVVAALLAANEVPAAGDYA